MSEVDLHIHSTASDGRLSPEEIIRKSAANGLTIIALADHDTVDGVAPALEVARAFPGLKVIPAIEMSTDVPGVDVHILGYFIDYTSQELGARLERMRNSRQERAQGIIAKLRSLGINIEWQQVQEIAGSGSIGRPHVAQAMLDKGYVASVSEAFTKYLGCDGPAYIEWERMTPAKAVELILRVNGLPVLAHPLTVNHSEALVIKLKAIGLVGIEAYYNGYTADQVSWLVGLARRHNLIVTGGSDYHGLDPGTETIIGGNDVPIEAAQRLIALAEQRALKLVNPHHLNIS